MVIYDLLDDGEAEASAVFLPLVTKLSKRRPRMCSGMPPPGACEADQELVEGGVRVALDGEGDLAAVGHGFDGVAQEVGEEAAHLHFINAGGAAIGAGDLCGDVAGWSRCRS